jgi:DNA ligase-1
MSNYKSVITRLRSAGSSKTKLQILSEADEFTKTLLVWTYSPNTKYYMKPSGKDALSYAKSNGTVEGYKNEIELFLTKSNDRSLSGNEQKRVYADLLSRLSSDEASILLGIILKNLHIGVSVNRINEVFPGLISVHEVMKAHLYTGVLKFPNALMSVKLDGIRGEYIRGEVRPPSEVESRGLPSRVLTRGGNEVRGIAHIIDACNRIALNMDEVRFDGELLIPGLTFQESSGKLRSGESTPDAVFHIFDWPNVGGHPLMKRLSWLTEMSKSWPSCLKLVKHVPVQSVEHIQRMYEKALSLGYEGLVIKDADSLYERKRSSSWLKMKPNEMDEVEIIGFMGGDENGRFAGTLGSIIGRRKDGTEVRVAGFTDEEREHIWNNQELWLGEIVEVNFHEVTPDGSFRHARFNRTQDVKMHQHRWDKSSKLLTVWEK